jgi:hypothetical protein
MPSFFSLIVFGVLLPAAVSGVAIAGPAWQEEWERVLRAAKSEGKLAMIGPLGTDRRDALTEAFQSKYGITVEYHADVFCPGSARSGRRAYIFGTCWSAAPAPFLRT